MDTPENATDFLSVIKVLWTDGTLDPSKLDALAARIRERAERDPLASVGDPIDSAFSAPPEREE